jgi:hypothetical protein
MGDWEDREIFVIIRSVIILMMQAANTSETSVNVYQTARRNTIAVTFDASGRKFVFVTQLHV